MSPLIFHVDMDAFFVSVEELFQPELKGKAVVVGGDSDQRGVVAAASYEARKFGVHSAMPLTRAHALCPHAVFLHGQRQKYQEYSTRIHEILCRYTPSVEMVSIDEGYLILTGFERLYGNAFQLAQRLRLEILERTGLSASIGLSTSRLVSKVASDLVKPAGILHIWPGQEAVFLSPLPIRKLPGIGQKTESCLQSLGVVKVGDLTRLGHDYLVEKFGMWGESLYRKSLGKETAHFEFHQEPQSISHETTFEVDTADGEFLRKTLAWLVQKVAHRLREHGMYAGTITLKLRNSAFETITRCESLEEATQLDERILARVTRLFDRNWQGQTKIRLLGVGLSHLSFGPLQEDLFEKGRTEKLAQLYAAADRVREKYGFGSVTSARTIK
jgi:DNA polymerase-4